MTAPGKTTNTAIRKMRSDPLFCTDANAVSFALIPRGNINITYLHQCAYINICLILLQQKSQIYYICNKWTKLISFRKKRQEWNILTIKMNEIFIFHCNFLQCNYIFVMAHSRYHMELHPDRELSDQILFRSVPFETVFDVIFTHFPCMMYYTRPDRTLSTHWEYTVSTQLTGNEDPFCTTHRYGGHFLWQRDWLDSVPPRQKERVFIHMDSADDEAGPLLRDEMAKGKI